MNARLCCAAVAAMLWLLLCLRTWSRVRREHQASLMATRALAVVPDANAVLVVHASQTGLAEQLAEQTVLSLRAGGLAAQAADLGQTDATRLRDWPRVLFIASTYGEGDPPDAAAAFADTQMTAAVDLHGVNYAVLALGDSSYGEFCGFGRRLDTWLRARGAATLFDLVEVDKGDAAALRHWQHHLALLTGKPDLPDWEMPVYQEWRLAERTLLNPGSAGGPCYHLVLTPADGRAPADDLVPDDGQTPDHAQAPAVGQVPVWQAGDIAEVGPRAAPGSEILPHREYSIASLPQDGAVHLLVRQMRREDGTLGVGSGWLTHIAPLGATISMRLRVNRSFHPPRDDRPMILVGNGTGLAGLRALLKARAAAGHTRNWLVFGERNAAHDYFHREDIEHWRAAGVLERLDTVFSRDQPVTRYVQNVLGEAAVEVRQWVAHGAAIYVCGSLNGMAGGVDQALEAILGRQALDALTRDGRYRRDVY